MSNKKVNKWEIGNILYFYNTLQNAIKRIEVVAIALDEDRETIIYNYLYDENKLFATFEECKLNAIKSLEKDTINKIYGIKGLKEGE